MEYIDDETVDDETIDNEEDNFSTEVLTENYWGTKEDLDFFFR